MMNSRTFVIGCRTAGIALLLLVGVGCTPAGNAGGRLDPYGTTKDDIKSTRAGMPEMLSFGDQVAQQLAQDLSDIDEIKNAPTKVVLEMGSISNKTATPTTDFEMLRNRLRAHIFQSKLIREHFLFVEGRSRMEAENNRVQGPTDDLLQEGATGATAKYDPKMTYVLQGDFFEANRADKQQFYFEFKLTNLASRQIVFQKGYDMAQAR